MLVGERLAACVNISAPMTSVYEWQGKLETGPEVAAFIKTRRALVEQAIAAARPLHPYTLPCFLILPIVGSLRLGGPQVVALCREIDELETRSSAAGTLLEM